MLVVFGVLVIVVALLFLVVGVRMYRAKRTVSALTVTPEEYAAMTQRALEARRRAKAASGGGGASPFEAVEDGKTAGAALDAALRDADDGVVILFLYGDRCPACIMLKDPITKAAAAARKERPRRPMLSMEAAVADAGGIFARFGVDSIPTLLRIDASTGKETDRIVGSTEGLQEMMVK